MTMVIIINISMPGPDSEKFDCRLFRLLNQALFIAGADFDFLSDREEQLTYRSSLNTGHVTKL